MRRIGSTLFGAVSNLLAQGIPFLLLLIVTPILIRTLGRETYGALILFNLLPQIAGQLDLGLVTAGTRAYAQYTARHQDRDAHRVIDESMLILFSWGALLAGALVAWRHPIARVLQLDEVIHGDTWVFAVAAIAIPIALVNGAALISLRALEQYGRAARIQIIAGVAYWIACTLAATQGATLFELVMLGTFSVAATSVALFAMVWQTRARKRSLASREDPDLSVPVDTSVVDELAPGVESRLRLRPFLSLGAGAFVAQASSLATYHTDKFLVSAVVSPAAAGAYALCANIANKILLLVASGATYTFPRAARLHAQGDHESLVRTFVVTTRFVLMIAAAFAVPLVALASPFLRTWIGSDFAAHYAPIMQLLVIGYAMNAASVVASNVAIGMGEVRLPALFALLGGTTTIVAVLVLAPVFGAAGAAGAALIGMSQAVIFSNLIASKLGHEARPASWPVQLRLVLVAVPVAVGTFYLGHLVTGWWSLLATGIVSTAVFLAIWLSTFGQQSERIVLDTILARVRSRAPNTP
jgi:O-antigen/teichoic acid export membrane protein